MESTANAVKEESPKRRIVALLLAILIGPTGAQWYYVGNWRWGLVQSMIFATWIYLVASSSYLVTIFDWFSVPGPGAVLLVSAPITLVSIIMILTGSFKDSKGRYLSSWQA